MIPDPVTLIIWLIAGAAGGAAIGELLKGRYDLGLAMVAGAIGGALGAEILQIVIPTVRDIDVVVVVAQIIVAAAGGAILTVAGAVWTGSRRGRQ
jgi:hypothetical protein